MYSSTHDCLVTAIQFSSRIILMSGKLPFLLTMICEFDVNNTLCELYNWNHLVLLRLQ